MTYTITVAICTYNRAERLVDLIQALRAQQCEFPFELLFVNNNSTDSTVEILEHIAHEPGAPLRHVLEPRQGIVYARNRAIEECLDSEYMVVMDDDEIPMPGFLQAAVSALHKQNADCAGGRVKVNFGEVRRPAWLEDNLLGFLAEVDYGDEPFWIQSSSTPVWTANIAYRTSLFHNGLRFDHRYNREGNVIGGGEDVMMFRRLLDMKAKIFYAPDMVVQHYIEDWRLNRRYFLKAHYISGLRSGLYELPDYSRVILGIPPFLFSQLLRHTVKALGMYLTRKNGRLRQAMNVSHALGMIAGMYSRRLKAKI